jgi:acyl-homoserine-lactone acylase
LLWREVLNRFSSDERTTAGPLFSDEFDPLRPTRSPAVPTDDSTALLAALARAVQTLTKAGFPLDSTLGAAQFTERSGTRIPIHGGTDADGVTNVVQWSGTGSSSETAPSRSDAVSPNSALRGEGFPVNFGTSFLMTVDYTGDQVQAWTILTYGQTNDRKSPLFEQQTIRFSEKNWRTVAFTDEQIAADPNFTERTLEVR